MIMHTVVVKRSQLLTMPAYCTGFKDSLNVGLLSFMLERSPTLGSVETSDYEKKQFALRQKETLKKVLVVEC